MTSTQKRHYDENYVFNYEQGMNLAFAFTAYDSETENILLPEYGKISFNRYSWGVRESGEYFVTVDEIQSHTCTREELGLNPEIESSFYSYSDTDKTLINSYQKKMRCIDSNEMTINGDFDSPSANLLLLRLEKCRESPTL